MCSSQRRSPIKKNDYFRALPKLALPPPLPLIRATWSSFFQRQKRRIARMTEKVQMMMMMMMLVLREKGKEFFYSNGPLHAT